MTTNEYRAAADELRIFSKQMILSASGWRALFNIERDPLSVSTEIHSPGYFAAALAADILAEMFVRTSDNPVIAFGMDSRPTGPSLGRTMIGVLKKRGIQVRSLGITPAPEIMAWTGSDSRILGFVYLSASHNPPGYNGIKFGLGDGSVLGGKASKDLISNFLSAVADPDLSERLQRYSLQTDAVEQRENPTDKLQAEQAYFKLTAETAFPGDSGKAALAAVCNASGSTVSITADWNGSARTRSIDEQWINRMGFLFFPMNRETGRFAHDILPEGDALRPCLADITSSHEDRNPVFGYVVDCDGDRGNIAVKLRQGGRILEAQEGFALCVLTELAYQRWSGETGKIAVAVNGPTSLRIKDIARAFDAEVFEAEVGEANVVSLAEQLREEGYQVRIFGEGSNGGNITYPSKVRDPLQTVSSLVKLLFLGDSKAKDGLFRLWCSKSGQDDAYRPDFTLDDILATLPPYRTTATDDKEAKVMIKSGHRQLKEKYEKLFLESWQERQQELQDNFGIVSWEEYNNEGTISRKGMGQRFRSGEGKGGLKIVLYNSESDPVGFLWMRGSGTEPVFRILVDARTDIPGLYQYLLDWHCSLVSRSDL